MTTDVPSIPESCSRCPHLDRFQQSCTHPLRQDIIQHIERTQDACPVYSDVRADAMRDLEEQLQ